MTDTPPDIPAPPGIPPTGVLFFTAPGCTSCRAVRARVASLGERRDAPIVEITADNDLTGRFKVLAAPTLIAVHNGEEVARHTGMASDATIGELCDAAAAGEGLGRRSAPTSLIALRLLVAILLAAVGTVTSTPTLVMVAAAIAVWAIVPPALHLYELRTR